MQSRKFILATALFALFATPVLAQAVVPATGSAVTGSTDMFMATTPTSGLWRSSEVVGQMVYNRADEKLGEIEELLIDRDGKVMAAVVGVGGFLGIGESKVAISYPSFEMRPDKDGKVRLVVNVDKAILKNAPVYKAPEAMKRT